MTNQWENKWIHNHITSIQSNRTWKDLLYSCCTIPQSFCHTFLYIGTRPIFLKWKYHTNYTLTMVTTCYRIGTVTARIQSNCEKLCQRRGLNSQPCAPQWQTTILTAFFRLSQRPGIVAAWYNHPKSRPVRSGHHFYGQEWPDQDLGLFWPKQHQPHC